MPYDYIQRAYGLTFKSGQQVKHTITGKSGTVKREDPGMGHYVMVQFDGARHARPCHPGELEDLDFQLTAGLAL